MSALYSPGISAAVALPTTTQPDISTLVDIRNQYVGSGVNVLASSGIVPTVGWSAMRMTVTSSGAATFVISIYDGTTTYQAFPNEGVVLVSGAPYTFTHSMSLGEAYNFQLHGATPAFRKLKVDEIRSAVI
jgi:hypothetical protein